MPILFALALCTLSLLPARAEQILVPMDTSQRDHLRAYGLAFWTLERGIPVEWLLNYRGGSFLVEAHALIASEAISARHQHRAHLRGPSRPDLRGDRCVQHGSRALGKGAEDRRVHAAQQTALGRRSDPRAGIRPNLLRKNLGRRSAPRRARRLRLAAPAPRGFHRPVRQVLRLLQQSGLVPRTAGLRTSRWRAASATPRSPSKRRP